MEKVQENSGQYFPVSLNENKRFASGATTCVPLRELLSIINDRSRIIG